MASSKPTLGVNDLQSQFPDIAAEAYGWDPETITAKSNQKKDWKCNYGHIWDAPVNNRTAGRGCPVCSGYRVLEGFNDLQTKFPEIAKEAYGWDPVTIVTGTDQKKEWKCNKGHIYTSSVRRRTGERTGCPICSGHKILKGFNDLQTKFPEIALEACGWDPTTIMPGTVQKKEWKCNKGHIYLMCVNSRTGKGSGCVICSGKQVLSGFNDLQTKFPDIAEESYGWDPTTVTAGTGQKKEWQCNKGHIYLATLNARTSNGNGCPVCAGQQVLAGFNDLKTKFPDIAIETYNWDPKTLTAQSNKKMDWKCNKGHIYSSTVANRTGLGNGCPVCSGQQVLAGFNDLQTKFPDIAAEAYGWDPTTIMPGTDQKKEWKCNKEHIYSSVVSSRAINGNGCPVCAGQQVLVGFNDLKTKFPDIAAEAYEWDPSTVTAGTSQKKEWKCNKDHIYFARISSRTGNGSGCPVCAESGFNPEKDAWFYLMERPGEQQLGISNVLTERLRTHELNGWNLIEHTSVPSRGQKVLDTEKAFKKWLKDEVGVIDGTTENWSTTKMEVQSLAELKARSGIETDLF